MLDLRELPTGAIMRLNKCNPRREAASLAWDLDLTMEVPDTSAAEQVDNFVPGALRVYEARESSKGQTKTAGGFDMAMFRLVSAEDEDEVLAEGHCEVRGAQVVASASQAMLSLKLRIHGLTPEAAMAVVYKLDEQVAIRLLHYQQLSLLPTSDTTDYVGKLIVHRHRGDVVAGIVASQDGKKVEVATMESAELVPLELRGRPDTVLEVRADGDALLTDEIDAYVARCKEAEGEVVASWHDVVTALGNRYAADQAQATDDSAWVLTAEVWADAFALACDPPQKKATG